MQSTGQSALPLPKHKTHETAGVGNAQQQPPGNSQALDNPSPTTLRWDILVGFFADKGCQTLAGFVACSSSYSSVLLNCWGKREKKIELWLLENTF